MYEPTKCTFSKLVFLIYGSSICFETEGSSSGRLWYMRVWYMVCVTCRPVFTHGARGPGPRAANFQGRYIKKIEIEVWYAEKKAVHEREI
jgi:hypothetical protein